MKQVIASTQKSERYPRLLLVASRVHNHVDEIPVYSWYHEILFRVVLFITLGYVTASCRHLNNDE